MLGAAGTTITELVADLRADAAKIRLSNEIAYNNIPRPLYCGLTLAEIFDRIADDIEAASSIKRNCDRFPKWDDAIIDIWRKETHSTSSWANGGDEWLLSPIKTKCRAKAPKRK